MNGLYESMLGNFPKATELYLPGDNAGIMALKVQYYNAWTKWEQTGMARKPPTEHWEMDPAGMVKEQKRWRNNGWYTDTPAITDFEIADAKTDAYKERDARRGDDHDDHAGELKHK